LPVRHVLCPLPIHTQEPPRGSETVQRSSRHTLVVLIVLTLASLTAGVVRAQVPSHLGLRNLGQETSRPLLDRSAVRLALALGATALLSKPFEDAEYMARALDSSFLDGAIDVGDVYGHGTLWGLASVGLFAAGRAMNRPALSAAGRDLSTSLVTSWAAVWTLKLAVNAERPNGGKYSFPSGHAATAFAVAPVVARHLGSEAGCASYAVATLTALARMEDRKHYLADVLVGAAIGLVSGHEVSPGRGRIAFQPALGGAGISVRF
jgi:membrane-associated phospholipid phosphatase